jgi:hypothetical protein
VVVWAIENWLAAIKTTSGSTLSKSFIIKITEVGMLKIQKNRD